MPLNDAKRRANNKYIAKTMTVLGCKIKKEEAEEFKEACKAAGTTPNAIFRAAIDDFMSNKKKDSEPGRSGAPEGGGSAEPPRYY